MIELKTISDVFDVGSSKRVFKSEWTSEGVPFYRAREVVKLSKNGHVDNELFISEEMFQEYSKKYGVPKSGDILVTGVGTLGICYQVKDHDRFYFKDGNIVWLKKREDVSSDYIEYCFKSPFVKRQIQSTADAAVVGTYTITNARNTKIPLPPLDQQKKIAAILDAADAHRQKTKALIEKYDELTQSLFLDMFGDPVSNPKGWEKIPLKEFGKVITGNTPSRKNEFNYNEKHIEWIKTNNIDNKSLFVTQAEEYLSKEGLTNGRSVKEGSLLIACIAGSLESIGRASLTNRKVAFNQQINAIEPSQGVNSRFLYYLFRMCPKYIQNHASKGMKRMLSKGAFQEIKMILPGFEIQTQFAERVQAIEEQKAQAEASLAQAEDLFNSLLQRAFKGELTT